MSEFPSNGEEGSPGEGGAGSDRDRFGTEELREVLAAFPLSGIRTMREFHRGSRRSPKLIIEASEGDFLLKRRADRANLHDRVAWSHAVIAHLESDEQPVARLVRTWDQGNSMLVRDEKVYELFQYIEGRRCDRTEAETHRTGRTLGLMHNSLANSLLESEPPGGTFHRADTVFAAFDRLSASIPKDDPSVNVEEVVAVAAALRGAYHDAARTADDAGFATLPTQPIHGDWHPGNIVFLDGPNGARPGFVAAVVDFDASRAEPRIVDLANGVLHFAMRATPGMSPATWPHTLSGLRMRGFIEGWRLGVGRVENREKNILPWLMIEAAIAESVVPVADRGRFATVPGLPFLAMVRAKVEWIQSRSVAITALMA